MYYYLTIYVFTCHFQVTVDASGKKTVIQEKSANKISFGFKCVSPLVSQKLS